MPAINHIRFSYNWNKKLDCKAFTTIRLNNQKYKIGEVYEIILEEKNKELQYLGTAMIEHIKTIWKSEMDLFTAFLDTGYNANQTKALIDKMYKLNGKDIRVDVILLIWVKKN
jgi:hypothetical protein